MQRIDPEQGAEALLRRRVAEIEEINEDLVAFARGHAGAVASIHEAVLAMLAADSASLIACVLSLQWPHILRVDEVAFAWATSDAAYRGDRNGIRPVEPRLVARMADQIQPVTIRNAGRGHPLFGAACATIRSEALIRLAGVQGCGLLILGQRENAPIDGRQGIKLLRFLGQTLSHMLERWPPR